jgi:regulator of chromosome condensation
MLNTRDKN